MGFVIPRWRGNPRQSQRQFGSRTSDDTSDDDRAAGATQYAFPPRRWERETLVPFVSFVPLVFILLNPQAPTYIDFLSFLSAKRNAFATTNKELADMPIAAIHGCTKPKAAAGKASRL